MFFAELIIVRGDFLDPDCRADHRHYRRSPLTYTPQGYVSSGFAGAMKNE
jgi:hypothetical protein